MSARAGQPGSEGQCAASVRTAGALPQRLLLPVCSGDGGEPSTDAAVGRAAPGASPRLHLDRVRFAMGWLGITLGVCMSGFEPA